MKIIISPAKNMKETEDFKIKSLPVFIEKSEKLKNHLKSLSYNDLKNLLICNDKIASRNYERFKKMNLSENLSPALLSYDGIQYKYMAPHVFEEKHFSYIENNLRILSGFYGILKPFDGIVQHRLEMQAKLNIENNEDLYSFWGKDIYNELTKEDNIIINLTSKEYRKCIEKYLSKNIKFISCVFGEISDDKIIEKGVHVKMARGEMVRFMAENNITTPEKIKNFNRLGYKYNEKFSDNEKYVFLKEQRSFPSP